MMECVKPVSNTPIAVVIAGENEYGDDDKVVGLPEKTLNWSDPDALRGPSW